MSATPWLEDVCRAMALLDTQRYRYPKQVRMHPLDIQAVMRKHGVRQKASLLGEGRFLDCPLIPDCAVTRGAPVAEYAE